MPALLLLIKVSLLLCVALAVARGMRRAPAASLHRLWSGAFIAVLMLPLLAAALPEIRVSLPQGWRNPSGLANVPAVATTPSPARSNSIVDTPRLQTPTLQQTDNQPEPAPMRSRVPSTRTVLAATWLLGLAAAMSLLALSFWRVRRMTRDAQPLEDPAWIDAAQDTALRLGMRVAPRLLMSSGISTPMAGGLLRPTVFLPDGAPEWSAERRDIVLAHEAAHLAGRDPLRQIVARIALAVYWFHPLAWLAAREAAAAREQACDEAVIALGTRPSTYARVLLDFADRMPAAAPALAALPMIQRTLLEKRLMAILNDDARPHARRLVMVPLLGVAVFTVSVAAVQLSPAVAGGVPGGIPNGVPGGIAGGAPGGSPGGMPGGATGGVSGGAAEGVKGAVTIVPAQDRLDARVSAQLAASESACITQTGGSFHGSISSTDRDGVTGYISEMVGRRGNTFVVQKRFGDLRLCLLAVEAGTEWDGPRTWASRARRLVIESQRGGSVNRMEIEGPNTTWSVDGRQGPMDAAAMAWRDRMFDVLETTWELSSLRGQESSLRGEISSIHGQRSSLQGEISSLQGQISSMQGSISSIHGQRSSLQGRISSIQGHVSSLQGAISSQQGAISSLNANRYGLSDAERLRLSERVREHERAIARIEDEIRAYNASAKIAEVEREIARLRVDDKVDEIRKQINDFDLDAKVQRIRRRIADLNVESRVAEIERRIQALNVGARSRELDDRRDAQLRALSAAMAAIR